MAFEFNFDNLKNEKIVSEEYLVFIQVKKDKLESVLSNPDSRKDYGKGGNTYVALDYINDEYVS